MKFNLPKSSEVRLGSVIYVPGPAENLLSLETLHLAEFESRGSIRGYELKNSVERMDVDELKINKYSFYYLRCL